MSGDPLAAHEQAPEPGPASVAATAAPEAAPEGPVAAGFGNAAVSRALAAGAAPQHLMALRPGMGNAALGRILATQRILARQDHEAPTPEELAEADAWAAEGIKRGTDLTPGNTGAGLANAGGGFDAEYDPSAGELKIIMRCGVEFTDGIAADGTPADGLAEEAEAIRNLPTEIERQQRLALFRWSPDPADPEKVAFKTTVESQIEGFWGGRHEFFLRKRGWSWLGATVRIDIQVDDKANLPNAHLTMKPLKVPQDVDVGAFVRHGDLANAQDNEMVLSSNLGATSQFLRHSITFGIDSSAIAGTQADNLRNVVNTFKGAETSPGVADPRSLQTPVVLTGHASSTGSDEHNQRLSEQRVAAVADFMEREGFVNVITRVSGEGVGETEATGGEVESDRRVDIVIGSGGAQNTVVHEFGHAFGLGDEYANTPLVSSGLGRDTGTPQMGDTATHDPLVKKMVDAGGQPLAGAVCEPTDSIMSVGDVVRPQHYSTFHAALTDITDQEPWALGPPTGRNDPLPGAAAGGGVQGPGDFPVPQPGEPVAV